jgi:hypothetical protein
LLFLLVLPLGCVPKPPENDVALIKELLVDFENGLRGRDVALLGSVVDENEEDLASRLITDFSAWGEIENVYIASKTFTIVGDSAKVELKLRIKAEEGEKKSEQLERPVNLFLNKRKGKWRIQVYRIMTDDVSRGKSEDE